MCTHPDERRERERERDDALKKRSPSTATGSPRAKSDSLGDGGERVRKAKFLARRGERRRDIFSSVTRVDDGGLIMS